MLEQASAGHSSRNAQQTEPDTAFLNEISTAAVAELLIKKGILNTAELLQQERELRRRVTSHSTTGKSTRGRDSLLRRWASGRRWSRHLTKIIFGWEWKKVRHEKSKH